MGSVVHTVISALGRWKQEGWEFKASVGYIARPCLKKKKKMQDHTYDIFNTK
jgi:hypothetical protein